MKRITLLYLEAGRTADTLHEGSHSQIYGLQHGILNLEIPPKTMWMNMGYWKDQIEPVDFPSANRALLEEVLKRAGIIVMEALSEGAMEERRRVKIVDVGFGCGDQSICLAQMDRVSSYLGITIDQRQFRFAQRRLSALGLLESTLVEAPWQQHKGVEIFCADAAMPRSWNEALKAASTEHVRFISEDSKVETWLLALDVLYHFWPSRQAIFDYAFHEMHASIVAFDLLLPDAAGSSASALSLLQCLLLRAISLLTFTPYSNFLTPEKYRAQLLTAGYAASDVTIYDISEHVFAPLATFLEHQDAQLRTIGKGLGAFHVARWMFRWWAGSGVVRGCVVIARKKK